MADEIFDLFGWTTSYTVNSNSGAILKFKICYNYKTMILFKAYIDVMDAAKQAADAKKVADAKEKVDLTLLELAPAQNAGYTPVLYLLNPNRILLKMPNTNLKNYLLPYIFFFTRKYNK